MNYRQWKKSYKKMHGANPPIEADKRKQRKLAKKVARDLQPTINIITTGGEEFKTGIADMCETLAGILSRTAAGLRGETERSE